MVVQKVFLFVKLTNEILLLSTLPLISHAESLHNFHGVLFVVCRATVIKKVVQVLFATQ